MKKDIKLGYEINTGNVISIKPSHLIVTGITQLSGKTTTLEALIKRSGLKAVIFKTKIGEKSFTEGIEIAPFFRDRSDYEFVKSLIEAYAKEKLFLEKGTLMRLCKGSVSLIDIKKRVDEELASGKLRGLKEEIHTRLQHYLENLIPQIQYANLSKILDIREGINIMNLERFSEEAQSLIIQSVADEVLKTMKDVIIVVPEAWKFLPQKYNNPCKRVVESFIRQGATNQNFIWIDSMPSYEAIFIKINGLIRPITFESLFNLGGSIEKIEEHEINTLFDDVKILDSKGHRLEWFKIKKVFRHHYKGKILSLNTLDGVIDVSPNHPICKYPRYVTEAKNIKIGDRLQSRQIEKKWRLHNNSKMFIGTEDLAWLLGFYTAEGWTHKKHWCLANKDIGLLKRAKEIIKLTFHLSASVTSPRNGVFSLDCNSPQLADYFRTHCYVSEAYNSETKTVPTEIINAPINIKKSYLEGYLLGDGSFDKERGYWRGITTTSRSVALGIIEIMNAIHGRIAYSLHIREDKSSVIEIVLNKQENILIRDRIKKIIEKEYCGFLYDIEVESPMHTFYMGIGNIRVHNSQDMAGVDKIPLKQISTWILGYQSERNEVKHTLDQISLPKKLKPTEEEIMTLKKGHFFLSCYEGVYSVYVQPSWLNDEDAIKIAKGKLDVDKIEAPDNLIPYSRPTQEREQGKVEIRFDDSKIRKDLIGLRTDFFYKIQELQNFEQKLAEQIYNLKSQAHEINEDELISKILQKIPTFNNTSIDKDSIIKEVLMRVPKSTGNVVYEVAPIGKIKKEFLEEAKQKILSDISTLSNNAKRTLKYLESRAVGCSVAEICIKGFMYKDGGGGYSKIVNDSIKELSTILVGEKQTNGKCFGRLRDRIKQLLEVQDAKSEEIEQVYNHIVMEMLK